MSQDVVYECFTSMHPCSIETISELSSNISFICGMYELLDEASQYKNGKIVIYKYIQSLADIDNVTCCQDNSLSPSDMRTTELEIIQELECDGGVLDIKINKGVDNRASLIAASMSTGAVKVFSYNELNEPSNRLEFMKDLKYDGDKNMYLSLDWSQSSSNYRLCTGTQDGSIIVFDVCSGETSCVVSNAHERYGGSMPVWTSIFNPYDENILLSGGDDCSMKLWDIRTNNISPQSLNKQTHQAGVTSLGWHPVSPNVFASGSYDENVRIWDNRSLKNSLQEIHVFGGVWRLKWKDGGKYIVSANMQGGSVITKIDPDLYTCLNQVIHRDTRNDKHLGYGIDVLREKEMVDGSHSFTLASCSFYDNLLQIWNCVC